MLYVSVPDFYEKVTACTRLTRQEELECARRMKEGDENARQQLIDSYLPMVAGYLRRAPESAQTLHLVFSSLQALEHLVDCFDFFQDREPFSHRLGRHLRQAVTRAIANR